MVATGFADVAANWADAAGNGVGTFAAVDVAAIGFAAVCGAGDGGVGVGSGAETDIAAGPDSEEGTAAGTETGRDGATLVEAGEGAVAASSFGFPVGVTLAVSDDADVASALVEPGIVSRRGLRGRFAIDSAATLAVGGAMLTPRAGSDSDEDASG